MEEDLLPYKRLILTTFSTGDYLLITTNYSKHAYTCVHLELHIEPLKGWMGDDIM